MSKSLESSEEKFLNVADAIPALKGDGWRATVKNGLEKVLGIQRIRKLFSQAAKSENMDVTDRILQMLNITVDAQGVLDAIPAKGGAIVIANHPFGGADAISLCSLCNEKRKELADAKVLANSVVYHAPKFDKFLLPLKILNEPGATRHNLLTLKQAATHVRNGGLLGVFPAGAVSRFRKDLGGIVTDAEWSEHIARIALKTKAPVIPIRYFGKNPAWYDIAGSIAPIVRAALIPQVLLSTTGKTIRCRAGEIVSYEELAKAENPTEYLRNKVYSIELP